MASGAGLTGGRRNLLVGPLLYPYTDVLWHLVLISYVVLGLVLLELGWAGVGISWLALFYLRNQFPIQLIVLGLVLLELGWAGVGISWLALF